MKTEELRRELHRAGRLPVPDDLLPKVRTRARTIRRRRGAGAMAVGGAVIAVIAYGGTALVGNEDTGQVATPPPNPTASETIPLGDTPASVAGKPLVTDPQPWRSYDVAPSGFLGWLPLAKGDIARVRYVCLRVPASSAMALRLTMKPVSGSGQVTAPARCTEKSTSTDLVVPRSWKTTRVTVQVDVDNKAETRKLHLEIAGYSTR